MSFRVRGRGRRATLVGLALASLTTLVVAVVPAAASQASGLVWERCKDGLGFDCATVTVPLDADKPAGEKIGLGLVRVRARDLDRRIGTLLVNPGGPGASGRKFARQLANGALTDDLRDRFDIVGWDPRGVGASAPVRCATNRELDQYLHLDPNPDNATERVALQTGTSKYAQSCRTKYGSRLGLFSTSASVRDMEAIRVALGEDQISYLGFSYGTYLGARYAQAYPSRVRAFVLDGALDPTADSDERIRRQAVGFESQLDAFLNACAQTTCRFVREGETPFAAFDRVMASVEDKPVKVGRRSVGPGEAWTGALTALYSKSPGWPLLREALADLALRRGGAMLALFDQYSRRSGSGSYDNLIDANAVINCSDVPASRTPEHYTRLADELTRLAPRFGAFAAYSTLVCGYWPELPSLSLAPATAPTAKTILVIGTTGDPATPFVWAQNLVAQLGSARLLTYDGDGHTALLTRNACVRKAVSAYLIDRKAPDPGARCAAADRR